MRGTRPRVYLAGPITGLDYKGATDWRVTAARELLPEVVGVSPMRGKAFLKSLQVIGGKTSEHYMAQAVSSVKGIVTRDRYDCRTCDAVLMNLLGAKRVSIGSMLEAGWADAFRTPLVLVMEPGNIHEHMMLEQVSGYVIPTLEEGIHLVKMLFTADVET